MRYLPNILTTIRIIIAPVFFYFFLWGSENAKFVAVSLFIIAALSDMLDGYLARRYNAASTTGRILDPIADKVLAWLGMITAASVGWLSFYLIGLVILRDVVVTLYRLIFPHKKKVISPIRLAKYKTTAQLSVLAVIFILSLVVSKKPSLPLWLGTNIAFAVVVVITLWTGSHYIKEASKNA